MLCTVIVQAIQNYIMDRDVPADYIYLSAPLGPELKVPSPVKLL